MIIGSNIHFRLGLHNNFYHIIIFVPVKNDIRDPQQQNRLLGFVL